MNRRRDKSFHGLMKLAALRTVALIDKYEKLAKGELGCFLSSR